MDQAGPEGEMNYSRRRQSGPTARQKVQDREQVNITYAHVLWGFKGVYRFIKVQVGTSGSLAMTVEQGQG